MQLFQESPVLDTEIDRLGHMNVMFYMQRVGQANQALMESTAITQHVLDAHNAGLRHADLYCRFHREQFAGATLQVLGGLLAMDARHASSYFEIRNVDNEQLAASFIIDNVLVHLPDRGPLDFPNEVIVPAGDGFIEVPEHGAPRSLKLDPPRLDVTLDELERRVVDVGVMGMMSGRFERALEPDECDRYGYLREGANLMFRGRPPEPEEDGEFGPPVLRTDEGHRFGWAIMETRAVVVGSAKSGQLLTSIGADVALTGKSRHSRRWTFDAGGALLGINDAVAVALDLDERRAIEIPGNIRRAIEPNYLPDLA